MGSISIKFAAGDSVVSAKVLKVGIVLAADAAGKARIKWNGAKTASVLSTDAIYPAFPENVQIVEENIAIRAKNTEIDAARYFIGHKMSEKPFHTIAPKPVVVLVPLTVPAVEDKKITVDTNCRICVAGHYTGNPEMRLQVQYRNSEDKDNHVYITPTPAKYTSLNPMNGQEFDVFHVRVVNFRGTAKTIGEVADLNEAVNMALGFWG